VLDEPDTGFPPQWDLWRTKWYLEGFLGVLLLPLPIFIPSTAPCSLIMLLSMLLVSILIASSGNKLRQKKKKAGRQVSPQPKSGRKNNTAHFTSMFHTRPEGTHESLKISNETSKYEPRE
jgi:hypothetical protein